MKSTQTLYRHYFPLSEQNLSPSDKIVFLRYVLISFAYDKLQLRTALMTGIRLGMESPVFRIVILGQAFFAHIKDVAVEEYEDGFLLSEVPMGEGILDLKQMVQILRQKDPKMIFDLEMITRDPLKIPVYTTKYWATFDDSYSPLPGRDLARVLAMVKKNRPKSPLLRITGMNTEAQLKAENDYNARCIAYARQNLDM